MDPANLKQSIAKELFNAIEAKFNKRGKINMEEAIEVAAYCLAVNHKILEKQMPPGKFNPELMENLFEGVYSKMEDIFPSHFKPSFKNLIQNKYTEIILSPNSKSLINSHYNNLFGSEGGNVL